MKIPLRFQATEYDCGTTSLVNAISYLYERHEIPAEVIKSIYTYTLDKFDRSGDTGEGGTSKFATELLAHWINNYSKTHTFKIASTYIEGSEVNLEKFKEVIKKKGVIVASVHDEGLHYVLVTDIDDENIYLFDPYYEKEDKYLKDSEVTLVFDEPFRYNRIVSLDRFFGNTLKNFALEKEEERSSIIITR